MGKHFSIFESYGKKLSTSWWDQRDGLPSYKYSGNEKSLLSIALSNANDDSNGRSYLLADPVLPAMHDRLETPQFNTTPVVLLDLLEDATSEFVIQSAYIAYYGRPADPGGLAAWSAYLEQSGGDLADIIDEFGTSAEFLARYGSFSNRELVNEIYRQCFGRDAEEAGLDGYTALLDSGERTLQSIALDILLGARNQDAETVLQKIEFSDLFTEEVSLGNISYSGVRHANEAKDILLGIEEATDSSGFEQLIQDYSSNIDEQDYLNGLAFADIGDEIDDAGVVDLDENAEATVKGFAENTDVFQITASASGVSDFELTGMSATVNLYLYSDSEQLLASAESNDNSDRLISYDLEKGQSYYVFVSPELGAESQYQLDFSLALETGGDDQLNGIDIPEAGNSQALATTIDFDVFGQASVSGYNGYLSDTADYFGFTALATGESHFNLEQLSADLNLALYAEDGSQLVLSSSGGSADESISYELVQGDTYFIGVAAEGNAASPYYLGFDMAVNYGGNDEINSIDIDDAGDTLLTSSEIGLDTYGDGTVSGSVGFIDDSDDFFQLQALASGNASFILSQLTGNLDLKLYSFSGELIASSTNSSSTEEQINFSVTEDSIYFLNVVPQGNAESEYELSLDLPINLGGDDLIGSVDIGDAGDDIARADPVTLDENGDALISGFTGFVTDESDYFSFVAPASGLSTLSLTGLAQDLNLTLFDSSGTQQSSSEQAGAGDETINYSLVTGQLYYASVTAVASAESAYSFSMNLVVNEGGSDVVDSVDIGDAPDQRNSAISVDPDIYGDATIAGSVGFISDTDDFYKFIAPSSGLATFNLSGLNQDINLSLFDATGNLLDSSDQTGSNSEVIQYTLVEDSTYYLGASANDTAESAYQLDLDLFVETGGNDLVSGADIGDASDSILSAELVSLDVFGDTSITGYNGFLNDNDDFYQFIAPATGAASFRLTELNENLNLQLFSSSGNLLSSASNTGNSNETINYALTKDSGYYLRVVASGSDQSAYTLDLDLFVSSGANDFLNGIDIGDVGDSLGVATVVDLDQLGDAVVVGSAGFITDSEDYYTFTAPASGSASLVLNGLEDNLNLSLYDSSGALLRTSTNIVSASKGFFYSLIDGVTYYLAVTPDANSESAYILTMDLAVNEGGDDVVSGSNIGDAGDSLALAHSVSLDDDGDASISGYVGFIADSVDYYQFSAGDDGSAVFSLSGLSENLDLKLFNSSGDLLDTSTNTGNANESISYAVTEGQDYYVSVEALSDAESSYELNLNLPEAVQIDLQQFSRVEDGVDLSSLPALGDVDIRALESDASWNSSSITYSFNSAYQSYYSTYDIPSGNWTALSTSAKAAAREAADAIENFTNLTLTEVSAGGGDINYNAINTGNNDGYSYFPSTLAIGGEIFLNYQDQGAGKYGEGSNERLTLIHELGHALGLEHPFEGPHILATSKDHYDYTVMSYTESRNLLVDITYGNNQANASYTWDAMPSSYQLLDIAAMQAIYGANLGTATGDDSYSVSFADKNYLTIWDAGGEDSINVASTTGDSDVDLRPGSFSSIDVKTIQEQINEDANWLFTQSNYDFGSWVNQVYTQEQDNIYTGENNLAIAISVWIENVYTGSGNDVVYDNAVDNIINTGAGDDLIRLYEGGYDSVDGGSGSDILEIGANQSSVTVQDHGSSYTLIGADFAVDVVGVETINFLDGTLLLS